MLKQIGYIMSKMKPWPHQLDLFDKAMPILKENALVYLAAEERTGKSLVAIMLAEDTNHGGKVLIITKKKAMDGWENTINNYTHLNSYTVINYESVHKITCDFDFIILDEPHAFIAAFPKKSKTWLNVFKLTKDKPIVYCSATSHAQGTQMLYHQLALSSCSPWKKFKDFYKWFEHYANRDKAGNFKVIYIGGGRTAVDYKSVNHDKVWNDIKHLFVTRTRSEIGFKHEPEDIIHWIDLKPITKTVYNIMLKDKVLTFNHVETGKDYTIVLDSNIKLRWALHMLEGGGLKYSSKDGKKTEYLVLSNTEKVDYILSNWGDNENLVIMYQYKSDLAKLQRFFKKARLLQGSSFAEGVDLSMHKHLVIYSQDFQTSKHTQRRARQANMNREEEIKVHFLLVDRAISHQVYSTVSINKTNFVDSVFNQEEI